MHMHRSNAIVALLILIKHLLGTRKLYWRLFILSNSTKRSNVQCLDQFGPFGRVPSPSHPPYYPRSTSTLSARIQIIFYPQMLICQILTKQDILARLEAKNPMKISKISSGTRNQIFIFTNFGSLPTERSKYFVGLKVVVWLPDTNRWSQNLSSPLSIISRALSLESWSWGP